MVWFLVVFPTLNVITADLLAVFGYRVKRSMFIVFFHIDKIWCTIALPLIFWLPCSAVYLRQLTYLFLFNNTVECAHQRKKPDRNSLTVASSAFKQLSERSSIPSTSDVSHFDCTTSISRFTPLDVMPVWHKLSFLRLECMHWMAGSKEIKPTQKKIYNTFDTEQTAANHNNWN